MAEVWLATDELLTRSVAVKLLKPALKLLADKAGWSALAKALA